MIRTMLLQLLAVCALSIALVACSDDTGSNGGSGGTAGGGGTAGSAGTGGVATDQCLGDPDSGYVTSGSLSGAGRACGQGQCVTLLAKLISGNGTDEDKAAANECILDCLLNMEDLPGLTTGCAQCFADSSVCGGDAGCSVCVAPESCACVDCLEDSGCQAELAACAGVVHEFECTL